MSIGQKKSFNVSLSELLQQRAAAAADQAGQAWPCHVTEVQGSIVTVSFDVNSGILTLPQVQMPIAESRYVTLPVQVGDRGLAISATVSIGAVSGLGAAAPPTLTNPGNLAAMVFVPIGNTSFPAGLSNSVSITPPSGGTIENNAAVVNCAGNLNVANGATGSFTTSTGQTVDVVNGIVVNIY